jgi:hypothetical protein
LNELIKLQDALPNVKSFGGVSLHENITKAIKVIEETELNRKVWNRKNSQWMWQNLTLFQATPMRTLRQVSAEIEKKRLTVSEIEIKVRIKKAEVGVMEEKLADGTTFAEKNLISCEIDEKENELSNTLMYIEGALKDLITLGGLHDQLVKQFEGWSEDDFEKEEARSHIKRSIMQCLRDVRQHGRIGKGEQEFLEQCGLNPTKILMHLTKYLVDVEQKLEGFGSGPLEEFLNEFSVDLLPLCDEAALRRGWINEINQEAAYHD